jgi:hypothetical protein
MSHPAAPPRRSRIATLTAPSVRQAGGQKFISPILPFLFTRLPDGEKERLVSFVFLGVSRNFNVATFVLFTPCFAFLCHILAFIMKATLFVSIQLFIILTRNLNHIIDSPVAGRKL